jgi:uncharacterized membrane protein (DUF2068 family)
VAWRDRDVYGRPLAVALVTAEKVLGAVAAGAGGLLALAVHHLGTDFLSDLVAAELRDDPHDIAARWLVHHLPHPAPGTALIAGLGLMALAVLLALEAAGFWYGRRWAEALIIVETAAFLPFEVWDIVRFGRLTSVIGLAANLLILVYVARVYRRRRTWAVPDRGGPSGERAG